MHHALTVQPDKRLNAVFNLFIRFRQPAAPTRLNRINPFRVYPVIRGAIRGTLPMVAA